MTRVFLNTAYYMPHVTLKNTLFWSEWVLNGGLVYNNACIVYLIMRMIKFLLKRNIFMPF